MRIQWKIDGKGPKKTVRAIGATASGTVVSPCDSEAPTLTQSLPTLTDFLRIVMAPAIVRTLREGLEIHQEEGERK